MVSDFMERVLLGEMTSCTHHLVASSVAIYMLTVGLGSLFWGPMVSG
jgi:hypothetical protein